MVYLGHLWAIIQLMDGKVVSSAPPIAQRCRKPKFPRHPSLPYHLDRRLNHKYLNNLLSSHNKYKAYNRKDRVVVIILHKPRIRCFLIGILGLRRLRQMFHMQQCP